MRVVSVVGGAHSGQNARMAEVLEPGITQPSDSARRSVRLAAALLVVVIALLVGVALSMWRPATFPRPRVLPRPEHSEFEDSCGGVLIVATFSGLVIHARERGWPLSRELSALRRDMFAGGSQSDTRSD